MRYVAALCCVIWIGGPARAGTITFDNVLPWQTIPNETGSFTTDGYTVTPTMGSADGIIVVGSYQPEGNPQGNQPLVNNGTPNLMCGNWVNLRIAAVGGRSFDLTSLELGGTFDQELVHRWAWASFVNIVGHRTDGGPDLAVRIELDSDFALHPVILDWTGLTYVEFVPEHSLVGTGPNDYEFTIDNLVVSALPETTPSVVWQRPAHQGAISALVVSPLGDRVVTGSFQAPGIHSWAASDGAPLGTIDNFGPVLAYHPDGQTVAAALLNTVYLWNVVDGTLVDMINEFSGWPPIVSLAYSPDGQFLGGGDSTGSTKIFHTALGEQYWQFDLPSDAVAFSPDGELFALGGANGWTRLWSMSSLQVVRTLGVGDWHSVNSLAFAPDGQTLVSGGGGDAYGNPGSIKWWRISDGYKLHESTHLAPVTSVAFTPDGRLLLACTDGRLLIFSAEDGALVMEFPGVDAERVGATPDGSTIFYGGGGGMVVAAATPIVHMGDFVACWSGPDLPPSCPSGEGADFDSDGDVDLHDFALRQRAGGT